VVAQPFIYELNTWVWLGELSRREGTAVDLGSVPEREWDAIAELGFDAVWLMGVWERSPAGIAIALANQPLVESFHGALPDFTADDVVGSPYCIRGYTVDTHLGGPAGLGAARAALAERGLGLVLDFVPNHVAPDHPWTETHPE
jgi:glycosidase